MSGAGVEGAGASYFVTVFSYPLYSTSYSERVGALENGDRRVKAQQLQLLGHGD